MSSSLRDETAGDVAVNAGLALAVASIVYRGIRPVSHEFPLILPGRTIGLVVAGCLVLGGFVHLAKQKVFFPRPSLGTWLAMLALVLFSDVPRRFISIFWGDWRFGLLAAGMVAAACIGARLSNRSGAILTAIGAVAAYGGLLEATGGGLLFSDDHPAFMYRLQQLKEHFPVVPFYNPLWNGGVEAREFFPSGVLNVFFLTAPFVFAFPLEHSYTHLVAILFFGLYPLLIACACRVLGVRAPLAPLLSLLTGVMWFRYGFRYGTLGFLTSVALGPLVLAALVRAAEEGERIRWRTACTLVLAGTLCALWTPSVFFYGPAALALAPQLVRCLRSKVGLLGAVAAVGLNLPWMMIFVRASNVGGFVSNSQSGEALAEPFTLIGIADRLREALEGGHPAILFLTVPGLWLLRDRTYLFRAWSVALLALLVLGAVVSPFKPRLELERMIFVAAYFGVIPVGYALARAFEDARGKFLVLPAVASVLLLPVCLHRMAANTTGEKYSPVSTELPGLAEAIRRFGGAGRVLFAGFILHELDGGHVTPLPYLTGHPLFASRYQHDRWEYEDVIPKPFRDSGRKGVEEFLELYNVTAVIAHDRMWRTFFDRNPERYVRRWKGERFVLFERTAGTHGWFLEGTGLLTAHDGNGVSLRPDSADSTVRFNYLPFLQVEGCERIEPRVVAHGVRFVRLLGCRPGQEARITAVSPLTRIFR